MNAWPLDDISTACDPYLCRHLSDFNVISRDDHNAPKQPSSYQPSQDRSQERTISPAIWCQIHRLMDRLDVFRQSVPRLSRGGCKVEEARCTMMLRLRCPPLAYWPTSHIEKKLTYRNRVNMLDSQLPFISLLDRPTTQFRWYCPTCCINPIPSFVRSQVLVWSKRRDMLDKRYCSLKWREREKKQGE